MARTWDHEAEQRLRFVRLTHEGLDIRRDSGQLGSLPRRELRSIRFRSRDQVQEAISAEPRQKYHITFTNGDWITATQIRFDGEQLGLSFAAAAPNEELRIPVEFISRVACHSDDVALDRQIDQLLIRGPARSDAVWLTNGDRVEGELTSLDDAGCKVLAAAGVVDIDGNQWWGLTFDPELGTVPPTPEMWAWLQLANGDRISATEVQRDASHWRVTSVHGFECRLAFESVARVDFWGDRGQPLTSIPFEVDYRPFLTAIPPALLDRSVIISPLTITDSQYSWGIGVWSGTSLRWTVPEGFNSFESLVGIDRTANGRGSVDFVVRVDGEVRVRSGRRSGADEALLLGPVDVHGGQQLELRAEFSDEADLHDLANWCRPVLRKSILATTQ
ncbi:MAG: NPCBM/NEW2 domain-containing protein [Planctomycetaceae bacterium]